MTAFGGRSRWPQRATNQPPQEANHFQPLGLPSNSVSEGIRNNWGDGSNPFNCARRPMTGSQVPLPSRATVTSLPRRMLLIRGSRNVSPIDPALAASGIAHAQPAILLLENDERGAGRQDVD